uniref:IST1-like protein n=1 Tax=Kalanchoe fedtschenkoi TaxID=63787 RepID=A0A7N0UY69_KALFE
MLHRSFKPAKCKTALKLAVSRIKLLKNKRAAHLVQMRRDVAQLLETRQHRTALIRVEQLVREEKTMAAYDLLEVYCELIAVRLPLIESQKNCPIDLKEAVTSVMFASPRCADLPELHDVRKHFQAKYGKEFTTAAVELRPGCGVSRLMIEKLSVVAPDIQTKMKILGAIALEHNIDWDPKTSGELEEKTSEDLLNGPNSFSSASQKYEVQTPNDPQKHDAYFNQHSNNPSPPPISENFGSSTVSTTSQSQLNIPITRADGIEHKYTYSGGQSSFGAGKQNWNMEFTDATSAAQAAAEAAERASMAARAAAELSSGEKFARQHPSESQRLPVDDLNQGSVGKHTIPFMSNVTDSADKLAHGGNPRMQIDKFSMKKSGQSHERPDPAYQNEGLGTFSGQLQMPPDPVFRNDGQQTYSETDASTRRDQFGTDLERRSFNTVRVQRTDDGEEGNLSNFDEQLNRFVQVRESGLSDSFKSNTSSLQNETFLKSSGQEGIYSHGYQYVKQENHFAGGSGPEMGSCNSTSAEAENINFFADEILHKQSINDSSESHSTESQDDHIDLSMDKPDDEEHGKFYNHSTETAVFDNYVSDNDVDYKFDVTSRFKEDNLDPFRSPSQWSPIYDSPKRSSWVDSDTRSVSYEKFDPHPVFSNEGRSSTKFLGDESETKDALHSHEPLPVAFDHSDTEAELEGYALVVSATNQPSFDTGKELNFGLLSGGFRNKGYKHPPYIRNPPDDAHSLPSGEINANDNLVSAQTLNPANVEISAGKRVNGPQESRIADKKASPRFKVIHYDPEDDSDSEDELPQISIRRDQERHSQNVYSVASHKSSFNSRPTYSDNDDLQDEKGTTVQVARSKARLGSGVSRRTKISASDGLRKPFRETYGAASSPVLETQTNKREERSEEPMMIKPAPLMPIPEVKRLPHKLTLSNEQLECSTNLPPAPNTGTRSSSDPKAGQAAPTRQETSKKASHVHPKLPDFDTLTAHFNSLRADSK